MSIYISIYLSLSNMVLKSAARGQYKHLYERKPRFIDALSLSLQNFVYPVCDIFHQSSDPDFFLSEHNVPFWDHRIWNENLDLKKNISNILTNLCTHLKYRFIDLRLTPTKISQMKIHSPEHTPLHEDVN